MTNQEVAKSLKNIRDLYPWGEDSYKTLDYAIRAVVELPKRRKEAKRWRAKALEQEPKRDRLYSWLNDMRLGIAPDETVTDIDERNVRTAQVDLLDEIMEWMVEPQERSEE